MSEPESDRPWEVYRATNAVNGKLYFGYTGRGWERRARGHIWAATRSGSLVHKLLHKAIKKYGNEAFLFELIYVATSEREAKAVEKGLIAAYGTMMPNGYNMTAGGEGVTGHKKTPEQKAKIAAAGRGRKMSAAAIAKTVAFHTGRKRSAETRARLSAAAKGRKAASQETRKKISESNRGLKRSNKSRENISRGKRGKKRRISEEEKIILSTRWIGRKHSEKTKAKMRATALRRHKANPGQFEAARAALLAKGMSAETKAKIGEANKGRSHPQTPETRAKIAAALKGKRRSHVNPEKG